MPHKMLADTLAARESISVNCGHPICCRSTKLDIQALIGRLGPDHGSMHWDLVHLFGCSDCKAAGRDRRPVFFTCIPDYEGLGAQPRLEADVRSLTWRPKKRSRKHSMTRRSYLKLMGTKVSDLLVQRSNRPCSVPAMSIGRSVF